MNCLSFDVGGTTIKYGVINNSYEVIHKDKIPTPKNEEKFIESLSEIIHKNINNISKVSVGMPGYVNVASNKYLYGPHLPFEIDFSKLSSSQSTNISNLSFISGKSLRPLTNG